jgi:hypothetical protein
LYLAQNGKTVPLRDGDVIHPGEKLILETKMDRELYVYVLNEDERHVQYVLFPLPGFETQNPLPAHAKLLLPGRSNGDQQGWEVSDRTESGVEDFLIAASTKPIPELEEALKKIPPARPEDKSSIAHAEVSSETRANVLRGISATVLRGVGKTAPLEKVKATGGTEKPADMRLEDIFPDLAPNAQWREIRGSEGVWRLIRLKNEP